MGFMEYMTNYRIRNKIIRKRKLILELSVDFCREIQKKMNSLTTQQQIQKMKNSMVMPSQIVACANATLSKQTNNDVKCVKLKIKTFFKE